MGLGDEIMSTALAMDMYESNPIKVAVGNGRQLRYSQQIFTHNPVMLTEQELSEGVEHQWLRNYPGHRHYIDNVRTINASEKKYVWRKVGPLRNGVIVFNKKEQRTAMHGRFTFIDPHVKDRPNKDWGSDKYQRLVKSLPGVRFVQPSYGKPILDGVEAFPCKTFRQGMRLMRDAESAVINEGGMHHAAAAVGTPAVVIYGGFISPDQTGYTMHTNLYVGGEPCGMISRCGHCRDALDSISVFDVAEALNLISPG